MHHNNPYSKAAGAYSTAATVPDGRMLEGTILLKAAQGLEELSKRLQSGENINREDIGTTLEYNQKLWQLFTEDMMNPEHLLPQEIKDNIASLALFVFKRTQEIMADTKPEKLKALVDINRNIAAGLMKRPAQSASQASEKPAEGERAIADSVA